METKPLWYYRQSAAIPVRRGEGQGLEILLISNRTATRWIVPKGIVERHLTPAESAAKEAWEEAGVRGVLWPKSVGAYQAAKWGGICAIEVFVLCVEEVARQWPESERRRRWLGVDEAVAALDNPDLAAIVRRVPAILKGEAL